MMEMCLSHLFNLFFTILLYTWHPHELFFFQGVTIKLYNIQKKLVHRFDFIEVYFAFQTSDPQSWGWETEWGPKTSKWGLENVFVLITFVIKASALKMDNSSIMNTVTVSLFSWPDTNVY